MRPNNSQSASCTVGNEYCSYLKTLALESSVEVGVNGSPHALQYQEIHPTGQQLFSKLESIIRR